MVFEYLLCAWLCLGPHDVYSVVVKQISNSYANDYFISKVISALKENKKYYKSVNRKSKLSVI